MIENIDNRDMAVLRIRKNTPGIGHKLARHFTCPQVTCGHRPAAKLNNGCHIINYGRSTVPVWYDKNRHILINSPEFVGKCVDKSQTLEILSNANIPCLESTTCRNIAVGWSAQGKKVIVRATMHGKMGRGISIVNPGEHLPDAPLYTKHYDKTTEYRIHPFRDSAGNIKIIDKRQKKRMGKAKLKANGLEKPDMLIRNHKRGWVFTMNDLDWHQDIGQMAIDALEVLGGDYAGVDILARWDDNGNFIDAVICEVNSAPGMRGSTFDRYVEAFKERAGG